MMQFSMSGESLTVYNFGDIKPALIENFSYRRNLNGSLTFYAGESYILYNILIALNAIENISYLDKDGEIIADMVLV